MQEAKYDLILCAPHFLKRKNGWTEPCSAIIGGWRMQERVNRAPSVLYLQKDHRGV